MTPLQLSFAVTTAFLTAYVITWIVIYALRVASGGTESDDPAAGAGNGNLGDSVDIDITLDHYAVGCSWNDQDSSQNYCNSYSQALQNVDSGMYLGMNGFGYVAHQDSSPTEKSKLMAIGSLVYYITEAGYPCNSPNNAKNCTILHFNARNSNADDNYPYYRTGFFGQLFHNQVLDRFAFHRGSEAEGEEDLVLIRVLPDELCDRNECIDVRTSAATYYLAANTSVNDEFYLTDDPNAAGALWRWTWNVGE